MNAGIKEDRTAIQRTLSLSALTTLAFISLLPYDEITSIHIALICAGFALAITGVFHRGAGATIAIVTSAFEILVATRLPWLVIIVIGLTLMFIALRFSHFRDVWAARGSIPVWSTALCAAVTPVALISWALIFKPDVSDLVQQIPNASILWLTAGSIVFAITNASFEELIWRGAVQGNLTALFSPTIAISIQALSFGIGHLHGFPRGIVGVAMATTWGIMLGLLRAHSKGVLAPILAHIVADATIAQLLIFWFR